MGVSGRCIVILPEVFCKPMVMRGGVSVEILSVG